MLSTQRMDSFSQRYKQHNGHTLGSGGYNYISQHAVKPQTDMNHAVNKYFHENVQLVEKEAKSYRKLAFDNVERIFAYINKVDPRFAKEPVRVGSYWQGLKVDKADEYDYSVVLDGLPSLVWCSGYDRFYGYDKLLDSSDADTLNQNLDIVPLDVPLPSPSTGYCWSSPGKDAKRTFGPDMMMEEDLVPILVKRQLKNILTEAIRNLDLRGEVRQSRKSHGPALTVYFTAGKKNISVDFAPFYRARLPFREWMGWPRKTQWPGMEKKETIKRIGVSLVAKKDFHWMYSFAEAEKELVAGVDIDKGKRKELHRVMKKLNADVWCNTNKPVISSYILKNIWFWEMERHPNPWDWDNDHLWVRLESMTRQLIRSIQKRKLKQYFYPENNLLKHKDPEQLDIAGVKIQKFLDDPLHYLIDD